ncbi:response regulator [Tamlana crocina]|uniref:Response regulator n=1 Tax=Tamlana crocina TaxID=393006 RepID=A0ABX1D7Q7_9FLAO|nr:response regulator [Tamlana crocina]NJX14366.1 response regulator [Tamlana crocina]
MSKIAIIDDNLLFRKVTNKLLQNVGYHVNDILMFENGKQAYDYIFENINDSEQLPETIFLDLNMPIVDGWSFLQLLQNLNKNHNYHPPVFIITSSVDSKDRKKAKSIEDIKGYLVKPIRANDIQKALRLTKKTPPSC